jgi:hypothetical protein
MTTENEENTAKSEKLLIPKASVLIQPRLRAPSTRLLYSGNINADLKVRNHNQKEYTAALLEQRTTAMQFSARTAGRKWPEFTCRFSYPSIRFSAL